MRVLLDTKDLIDLTDRDHGVGLEDFRVFLTDSRSMLVLTFSGICEIAAPLSRGGDRLKVRQALQKLESLPHCYLREADIPYVELRIAARCFSSGREYEPMNPYVSRWDETTLGPRPWEAKALILRLDQIVLDVAREDPDIFAGYRAQAPIYRNLVEINRRIPAHKRDPEENFVGAVQRQLRWARIETPAAGVSEFAEWIHEDPRRCPGFRLVYESFHEFLKNVGHKPEAGDIPDFSMLHAVPYVDAGTLDRRTLDYCGRASAKLAKRYPPVDYRCRVFKDTRALVEQVRGDFGCGGR